MGGRQVSLALEGASCTRAPWPPPGTCAAKRARPSDPAEAPQAGSAARSTRPASTPAPALVRPPCQPLCGGAPSVGRRLSRLRQGAAEPSPGSAQAARPPTVQALMREYYGAPCPCESAPPRLQPRPRADGPGVQLASSPTSSFTSGWPTATVAPPPLSCNLQRGGGGGLDVRCTCADSRHPQADQGFFQRREFCFTLDGDIFVRYQSFKVPACGRCADLSSLPARLRTSCSAAAADSPAAEGSHGPNWADTHAH